MPVIEVKNNFARHTLLWWFTMPIAATLVLPMVFPHGSFNISKSEMDFFADYGRNIATVTVNADVIFKSAFVNTGIAEYMGKFFSSEGAFNLAPKAVQFAASAGQNYNSAFWMMIYRGIWRFCALWPIYVGIFFSMVLPSFIDGLVTRAKKSFNFQFHNPVYFYSSMHTAVLVLGMGVFIPLLPMDLNSALMAGFSVLLCLSFWVTASNFQTGN